MVTIKVRDQTYLQFVFLVLGDWGNLPEQGGQVSLSLNKGYSNN